MQQSQPSITSKGIPVLLLHSKDSKPTSICQLYCKNY
jgi:hypothetical protein